MKRTLLILFTTIISQSYSQDFLEKDSINIKPLDAYYYYLNNTDSIYILGHNKDEIHELNPFIDYDNLTSSNLASESIPILHKNRYDININFKKYYITDYTYHISNIPYFQTNRPLSKLDFIFFGNRNEEFNGYLNQNISSTLNLGFGIRKSTNRGFFLRTQNSHDNLYLYLVHQKKSLRTNIQATYNHIDMSTGGMILDVYNDALDKNLSFVEPAHNNTKNSLKGYTISLLNTYSLFKPNDHDSIIFKPLKSNLLFENKISYSSSRIIYDDQDTTSHIDDYGLLINDSTKSYFLKDMVNTWGIENNIKFYYKNIKFIVLGNYFQNYLLQSAIFDSNHINNSDINLGIGAKANISIFNNASLHLYSYINMTGYKQNDYNFNSLLNYRNNLLNISTGANYTSQKPGYFYDNFYSSEYNTSNNFINTNTIEGFAEASIFKNKLDIKAQYYFIDNFLVLDSNLIFKQVQNNFFQAKISSKIKYKSLHFPTVLYYNNSLFKTFFIKQSVFLSKKAFSNSLKYKLGVDILLNMDYNVPRYSPLFMMKIFESNMNSFEIYPNTNMFLTLEISKVNLSFIYRNIMSSILNDGTSYLQNYPIAPGNFLFRIEWDFLD